LTVRVNWTPPEATLAGLSEEIWGKTTAKAFVNVEVVPLSMTLTLRGTLATDPEIAGAKEVRITGDSGTFRPFAFSVGCIDCDTPAVEVISTDGETKFVPLIDRLKLGSPTLAVAGDRPVAVGGGLMVKVPEAVVGVTPGDAGEVTVMVSTSLLGRFEDPAGVASNDAGMVAVMEFREFTVELSTVVIPPLRKVTVSPVMKPEPEIVTLTLDVLFSLAEFGEIPPVALMLSGARLVRLKVNEPVELPTLVAATTVNKPAVLLAVRLRLA